MAELIRSKQRLKIDSMLEKEYEDCIRDLISHELIRTMKEYIQHGDISCLDHSLYVSYVSYKICRKLGFDFKSAARGGLLHDFFLYDWHKEKPYKGLHGFIHPRIALQNADKYFTLNNIERDIIRKHMWPLTISLPKYKETFVVLIVDKYCATMETLRIGNRVVVRRLKEIFSI